MMQVYPFFSMREDFKTFWDEINNRNDNDSSSGKDNSLFN